MEPLQHNFDFKVFIGKSDVCYRFLQCTKESMFINKKHNVLYIINVVLKSSHSFTDSISSTSVIKLAQPIKKSVFPH